MPFLTQNALKQAGINDYLLIELENREDCAEVQDYLQGVTGGRTVNRFLANFQIYPSK